MVFAGTQRGVLLGAAHCVIVRYTVYADRANKLIHIMIIPKTLREIGRELLYGPLPPRPCAQNRRALSD